MTQAYSTLRVAPGDDGVLEVAERYGWINRAVPDADLDGFVARLARRIASFPADAPVQQQRYRLSAASVAHAGSCLSGR